MKNSIVAKIPFHFKGQAFEPSSRIDLDDWTKRGEETLPDLVKIIAQENQIGSYSYELEVMEVSEIEFESPTGRAEKFWDPEIGTFDFNGFKQYWLAEQAFTQLNQISENILGASLEENSKMHQALMQAFLAGKDS
nr:hypothetical protein [uncultured bacterium]